MDTTNTTTPSEIVIPDRIDTLKKQVAAITPDDSMSEAVRKALLPDFINMLRHEKGSQSGEDIEDVHAMRVATRRIRSVLRLLSPYFKSKTVDSFQRSLRRVARSLGGVRDLDVLIEDLRRYQLAQPDEVQTGVQGALDLLEQRRTSARQALIAALLKRDYHDFVDGFEQFLLTPGAAAKQTDTSGSEHVPSQVGHVLPVEVFSHLANVRAYETLLDDADNETLHQLRIEGKRLRYLLSMFEDLLGASGKSFIKELKLIQDHLGRLHDVAVWQDTLNALMTQLSDSQVAALRPYVTALEAEEADLRARFPEVWRRFNTKTVQRQLATALAGL